MSQSSQFVVSWSAANLGLSMSLWYDTLEGIALALLDPGGYTEVLIEAIADVGSVISPPGDFYRS